MKTFISLVLLAAVLAILVEPPDRSPCDQSLASGELEQARQTCRVAP